MWSALRSDLKEFTSSLANDGNQVIQMIEKTLVEERTDNGHEGIDDGEFEESPSILIGEDGEIAYVGRSNSQGNDDAESVSSAMQEAVRRMADEDTYLEPLLIREVNGSKVSSFEMEIQKEKDAIAVPDDLNYPQVESGTLVYTEDDDPSVIEFLQNFDIQSKTDEISSILEQYPDSIHILFESLVPVRVTYEQFWQRYFYRCDETRIRNEWDAYDEQVRRERQEIIDKGKQTVSNLLGGALKLVKRVGNHDNEDKMSTYEKYQKELEQKKKSIKSLSANSSYSGISDEETPSLLGGLFRGSRPPFVMNTAVDDDEDYIDDEEEGNDGDSFGWGTDEEDAEKEEKVEVEEEDEISFEPSKPNIDPGIAPGPDIKSELEQVREERDQLHETIVMLKKQLQDVSADATENSKVVDAKGELTMQLLQKDSELQMLKAKLEMHESDSSKIKTFESKVKDQEFKIQEKVLEIELLKSELLQKEQAFDELMLKVDSMVEEEDEKDRTLLQEALETITSLQAQLESSKAKSEETIEALKRQHESDLKASKQGSRSPNELQDVDESFRSATEFSQNIESPTNEFSDEVLYLQTELADAQSEIDKLRREVERIQMANSDQSTLESTSLNDAQATIDFLKSDLESNKIRYEEHIKNMNLQYDTELQSLKQELESTKIALSTAKNDFADRFEQTISQLKQSHSDTLNDVEQKYHGAVQQLKTANDALISLQTNEEILQKDYMSKMNQLQDDVDSVRKVVKVLEEEKAELIEKCALLETKLSDMKSYIASLPHSLDNVGTDVRLKEQVKDNLASHGNDVIIPSVPLSSQTSSLSSVVEVKHVKEVVDGGNDGNDAIEDDSEGWGDDWSDEE